MNQPDVEATLCQCLLSLCQRAECRFCHNRFTCGRCRYRSHRRRLFCDRRARTGRCHGRIKKPLSGLFPAFSSYSRHIRPERINGKHYSLFFQPASNGFQALPIVEGNLNLRPHRPQLPSLGEGLFPASRCKALSCSSNPLIQAAFCLIVVHDPIKLFAPLPIRKWRRPFVTAKQKKSSGPQNRNRTKQNNDRSQKNHGGRTTRDISSTSRVRFATFQRRRSADIDD